MQRLIAVGPTPPPYTGQAVAFAMVLEEATAQGITTSVVDLSAGLARSQSLGGVSRRRLLAYLRIFWQVIRFLPGPPATFYLTIAQSRAGWLRDAVMITMASLRSHRIVLHLHGGNYHTFFDQQPTWLQAAIRWTLRQADAILVLGEGLRSMFDFEPAVASRIHVVANGTPTALPSNIAVKSLPQDPDTPIQLLYLSNLVESKGYLDVLEAVHLLRSGHPALNIQCHFCGEFLAHPPDDVRVRSTEQARKLFFDLVATYDLQDIVRWHGTVTGEAKLRRLQEAHVFLLPTEYNNEGQPLAILEAMAHGCVVLTTDYRAIPDMVIDGQTGVLVPFGQPGALADAIRRFPDDPERYARMSHSAIELIRKQFTRDAHLQNLFAYLERPAQ